MSEPSCSQESRDTSPPELLEFQPDLLCSHRLSFLGVGADLTYPWGVRPGTRASTPQDPPCHMVTALLRDQDKVLLLAHTFPMKHVQDSLPITLLPLGPPLGLPAGVYIGCLGCLGQLFLSWILQSQLQYPSQDYTAVGGGLSLYSWLDLSFYALVIALFQSLRGTVAAQPGQFYSRVVFRHQSL